MEYDIISTLTSFIDLSEEQTDLILELAEERNYAKGDYFLRIARVENEFGYVREGLLRYYTIDEEGNELTSMFIEEGVFFTDLRSYLEGSPSEGFIQAETAARVTALSKSANERLKTVIPGWGEALKDICRRRLLEQLVFSRKVIELDARSAYAAFKRDYPTIAARVPDAHLASFLGISRFTLSRVRKQIV